MLDPGAGSLAFANAGHNPPVIVRASGKAEMLEGGGPPLGILPLARYREMRAQLDPGDALAIYSDGVTEASNAAQEEFGEERLSDVLSRRRAEPAAAMVQAVTEALTEFAAGSPPADDITLMVARRL